MDLYKLVVAMKLTKGGGGSETQIDPLSVTENGTYTAEEGHAFDPVTVSVPSSGITPVGTKNITENGVFDVASFASASVSVPIPSGYIKPSGTSSITANGMYDVTNFASASVNVPGIVPSGTSSITSNGIYDITNFASVDVNVEGGGGGSDHDVEDAIIDRTISGVYTNSRVTEIGDMAFAKCVNLTGLNFPNVTTTGSSAFMSCTNIKEVYFPNLISTSGYAFLGFSNLESAYCPKLEIINTGMFKNCSKLRDIDVANAKSIYAQAFAGCSSLETLRFTSLTGGYIGSSAFSGCTSLMSLYLLSPYRLSMYGDDTFYGTPMSKSSFTGSFGSIYVPASLVSSYKEAAGWRTYSDRITSYVE